MCAEYDIGLEKALSKMFGQLTWLAPVDLCSTNQRA
jgi:hypothetical protein